MRKVKLDHRKNNANILSTENLFFITYYVVILLIDIKNLEANRLSS